MVMKLIYLSRKGFNWPSAITNFYDQIIGIKGKVGFNNALTANGFNASIRSIPSIVGPEDSTFVDYGYVLEFDSNEEYVEFMLRWG